MRRAHRDGDGVANGGGRQARSEEKRLRIRKAAQEVFTEQGFEAARMDEVARRARVSKGTLYHFFTSKEDLLIDAVAASMEASHRLVRDSLGGRGAGAGRQLAAVLRALLLEVLPRTVGSTYALHNQVWGVIARDPALRGRVFAQHRDFYRDREREFEANVVHGGSEGVFREDLDPAEVGLLLLAIFDGLVRRATFDGSRIDPERALAVLLKLLDGGLYARDGAGH